jgi:hypothetical protein
MNLFKDLTNYQVYLMANPFYLDLGINLNDYGQLDKKVERSKQYSVNPEWNEHEPCSAELDDLIRLHYLITSRKVTTVLEIGPGKSTVAIDHALEQNKINYGDFVKTNLRRSNPFESHSIDNNKEWIELTKSTNPSIKNTSFHYCPCHVTTFNDRICTMFDKLPNICPDLIYLDGPDQFSPIGDVRGISTQHPDRLPMSADILAIEHFLLPGTLIIIDGRTANARFLKKNLQGNWAYFHSEEFDQHFFELRETPLGPYNKKQIEFCLGSDWI